MLADTLSFTNSNGLRLCTGYIKGTVVPRTEYTLVCSFSLVTYKRYTVMTPFGMVGGPHITVRSYGLFTVVLTAVGGL